MPNLKSSMHAYLKLSLSRGLKLRGELEVAGWKLLLFGPVVDVLLLVDWELFEGCELLLGVTGLIGFDNTTGDESRRESKERGDRAGGGIGVGGIAP